MTSEDASDRDTVQRLMRRLHDYAQGLGLDDDTVLRIVERVITDTPDAYDLDRMAEARARMLEAAR